MKPKIVCLDGYTLNPGDITWEAFAAQGDFKVHDRTPVAQTIQRAKGAAVLLTNKVVLNDKIMSKLPELKYIGVLATGYNIIETAAAKARGIVVTNVPTYGTDSVAQHAAGLMLELARRIGVHNLAVHKGAWSKSKDWCFALGPVVELTGRTLGIVGLGRIGLALARIGAAMGMKIMAVDAVKLTPEQLGGVAVQYVTMDELFRTADVISLHCPLTPETKNLVDAKRLATMKPTALLINTSRGPLIDEKALAKALKAGKIGGAGLDVLPVEPPARRNPLMGVKNCVITPHLAWYAREARQRLMDIAAGNLRAYLAGKPVNVVNR